MSIVLPKNSFDFFTEDNPEIEISSLKEKWKMLNPKTRNEYIQKAWNERKRFDNDIKSANQKIKKTKIEFKKNINNWRTQLPTFYMMLSTTKMHNSTIYPPTPYIYPTFRDMCKGFFIDFCNDFFDLKQIIDFCNTESEDNLNMLIYSSLDLVDLDIDLNFDIYKMENGKMEEIKPVQNPYTPNEIETFLVNARNVEMMDLSEDEYEDDYDFDIKI